MFTIGDNGVIMASFPVIGTKGVYDSTVNTQGRGGRLRQGRRWATGCSGRTCESG